MRDIASERGIAAVGISGDKPDRQKQFDEKCDLGYSLLSDPDHEIAEAFGVWRQKKMYGNTYWGVVRSAFLVDEDGRIEHAWYKISPKNTAGNLAAALPEE